MRVDLLATLAATCVALLPAPAAAQARVLTTGSAQEVGMSESGVQAAVALYRDAVDRGEVVGAVLLIARNGKVVVHEAFGWRDVQANAPMHRTTLFRMSSNTKPVTATAVAILADRGTLRFSDSVKQYIPSWNNRQARNITIHQLLSHTSGITIDALFARTLVWWPWRGARTLRTETDRIGKVGAAVTPGTSYFYTNAGYNALGGLIETVSGQSLDAFVHNEIFRKLGMSDSYMLDTPAHLGGKISRLGPTYANNAQGRYVAWKPGDPADAPFARGSGGLVTTAWDYAVFMQMLLNGGVYNDVRVLRSETAQRMLTAHTPAGARGYGYGWGINPDGIFTHSGSTGTYAWGDPVRGIIVVALTQTNSASDLRPRMMELVNRAVDARSSSPDSTIIAR